jgi:hypothetical protein
MDFTNYTYILISIEPKKFTKIVEKENFDF